MLDDKNSLDKGGENGDLKEKKVQKKWSKDYYSKEKNPSIGWERREK